MIKFFVYILNFLNSNLGAVTLIVGLFAIYLYLTQKKDTKRNAAKLILQEIRYAEQQIRNHRVNSDSNYYLADKLLPTNSWNKNVHYFIKEIEESEIDLISRFYSHSQYLDTLIEKISQIKSNWYIINGQTVRPELLKELAISKKLVIRPEQLTPIIDPQQSTTPFQTPSSLQQSEFTSIKLEVESYASVLLRDVSSKIEFIYNTPAVEKLRNIAKRKWYQLF